MSKSFRPSFTAILVTILSHCGWIGCHLLCEAFAPPLQFSSCHRRCLTKENDTILFAPKVMALTSRTPSTPLVAEAKQNDAGSSFQSQHQQQPYVIRIEYCTGCRWGLRGFWTAQELLSTFRDDRNLGAVTVMPSSVPGRFTVSAVAVVANEGDDDDDDGDSSSSSSSSPPPTPTILWDRQEHDGFPEMKQLKQLIRDVINPEKFLGHSDSSKRQENETTTTTQNTGDGKSTNGTVLDFSKEAPVVVDTTLSPTVVVNNNVNIPHVTITYCTGCQWLMRAAYVAQELVSTFVDCNQDDDDDDDDDDDKRMTTTTLQAVALIPSRPPAKGGAFLVTIDGTKIVWDRFEQGRFPETKELKQSVRDVLRPGKDLGQHIVGKNTPESSSSSRRSDEALSVMDNMDDDEAAEARKFFGVM